MSGQYILGIDQSTQGTKGLLFDKNGALIARTDVPHAQLVDERGWVEHDPKSLYENTLAAAKAVLEKAGVQPSEVIGAGISNQRETAVAWNRQTGEPVYNAIVWQCARGAKICEELASAGHAKRVKEKTGMHLSPYFSAAKLAWILQNIPQAANLMQSGNLCMGTVDSWLLYNLTNKQEFKTDYSNASRTQLFHIVQLCWDQEICKLFGINPAALPQVCDSDSLFGLSDFGGLFPKPIPIHSMMGDSHGALYGQGGLTPGTIKSTYGTGSSVMMNIGEKPVFSDAGVVTSLAWGLGGKVDYVLEGNINYTGAVTRWIVQDLGLLSSAKEASAMAEKANPEDETYLVPAFSGLNAPYWDSNAKAAICGMTRTTGKAEIVKAAEECIAYQIADIVNVMSKEAGIPIDSIRVDGGPTKDRYLMQFQSDILGIPLLVSEVEELSGTGAAFAAGVALGFYQKDMIFSSMRRTKYQPVMPQTVREKKYSGWKAAVSMVLAKK